MVDVPPDGRGRAHELLGGRIESCEVADEHVTERRRDRIAVVGGGQQLLGDERVAVRAGEHALDQLALRHGPQDAGQQRAQVDGPKAREVDPLDPTGAADPRQPGAELRAGLSLVVAERGYDEHALVAQVAHDEREQVERRGIGPVHVLDDPDDRLAIGQAAQHSEQQLEQAALGQRPVGRATGCSQLGQQAGELGPGVADQPQPLAPPDLLAHPAQRLDHGQQRRRTAGELDATSDRHARPRRLRAVRELRHEPRLADAGLAADEDRARFAGRGALEPGLQRPELLGAPDERPTREPTHGVPIIPRPDGTFNLRLDLETWRDPGSNRGHHDFRQLHAMLERPRKPCNETASSNTAPKPRNPQVA